MKNNFENEPEVVDMAEGFFFVGVARFFFLGVAHPFSGGTLILVTVGTFAM